MTQPRSPWLKRAAAQMPVLSLLVPLSYAGLSAAPLRPDVREEINKTITLNPNANVEVRGINGPVEIETWNGSQAEIHITITASSREVMETHPLLVDNTPDSLTIHTEKLEEVSERRGNVHHRVRLRLPTSINLKLSAVNGRVEVGEITGAVAIRSINGGVHIAQAGSASEISSVNGGVTISLNTLGERGLRVSSINGGIDLRLPAGTNAELDVRSVNGGVDADFPLTVTGEVKRGELRATLGSGGARIEISSVNGGVHLKRL